MDFVFETQDSRHGRPPASLTRSFDLVEQFRGDRGLLLAPRLVLDLLLALVLRHVVEHRGDDLDRRHRNRLHRGLRLRLRVTLDVDHDTFAVEHRVQSILPERRVQVDRVGDLLDPRHAEITHGTTRIHRVRLDPGLAVDAEGVDRELDGVGVETVRRDRVQAEVREEVGTLLIGHLVDPIENRFFQSETPDNALSCVTVPAPVEQTGGVYTKKPSLSMQTGDDFPLF